MRNCPTIKLLVLGLLGLTWLSVLSAAEKEPVSKVDEVRLLRAEVKMLRRTVKSLREQNTKLAKEVKRLRDICRKAGIDVRESHLHATTGPAQATTRPKGQDSNTIVAKAIHEFISVVDQIERSEKTDIQKRAAWLEAAKKLDSILRKNRITITYTIEDVKMDKRSNSALLNISSVRIQSSDPNVGDIKFSQFYEVRIFATEAIASKITKHSTMTIEGTTALNVVFYKPPAEQPSLYGEWDMPGYRPIGYIHGDTIPDSVNYWRREICLMVKKNCLVKVNGVPRKLK